MFRIITILITLTMLPAFFYAQEVIVLPEGNIIKHVTNSKNSKVLDSKKLISQIKTEKKSIGTFSNTDKPLDIIDTIYMVPDPTDFSTNFGFFGQDYMVQWFQAPADLSLKEVGFSFYSAYPPVADLELKIIACNLPIDSLEYLDNELWGFYQSPTGCHDSAAAFFDTSGIGWISINGSSNPIGYDIWSDQGVGYTFTPIIDSIIITYQFIDLGILGYPEIPAGTVFGVVLKNTVPLGESRVGLRGTSVGTGGQHQNSLFKFYCEEYTLPFWPGWWSRDVTLGYAIIVDKIVSVEDEITPTYEFELEQNFPNPFNPVTSIQYAVGSMQFVTLKIFDILGREIATLVNEEKPAGSHEAQFDASKLPSGIYFYKLHSGKFTQMKKMVLLR